jgi:hypothetical protein
MVMELDGTELRDVRDALLMHRDTLLAELAHADKRHARGLLRERVERVERLLQRLPGDADRIPPEVH